MDNGDGTDEGDGQVGGRRRWTGAAQTTGVRMPLDVPVGEWVIEDEGE